MDAIVTRRFRLAGKLYEKDAKVSLPANQFRDFEGARMVERAPVKAKKPVAKPTPKKADETNPVGLTD